MTIENLTPVIGSIVHDIDLSDPGVLEAHGDELRRLFLDRQVIFFRNQKIDGASQVNLARLFGSVRPVSSTFPSHPDNEYVEILKSKGSRTGTDIWHADLTWQENPPVGACLYAVNVPQSGGDTMWASMTDAYDSLDDRVRELLEQLKAVHDWEGPELIASIKAGKDPDGRYADMRLRFPPIEHPVVKVHPETGRKLIFVNSLYCKRITPLPHGESARLLDYLSNLANVPERQVRFRWQPGSIAIWDNRSVQHYAVNDYHPFPREMHRVAIF
ncbi:taurine dioxygenase (plasmid) [Sphingomonas sp. IC081]|nr:taurine dioxygenase [Sphingomonas sp. IC081]